MTSFTHSLPSPPKVSSFVVDFEKGLWKGLRSVFDDPVIHGCSFHFKQALYKQVQKKGLTHEYEQNGSVYNLLRKVFALPFLPADDIADAFQKLNEKVDASAVRLTAYFNYVRETWITNTMWPLPSISVYGRSIRTNNDVEGWHNRINRRAMKSGLPLYLLITLLYTEVSNVPTQLKLIKEGKLRRHQRKQQDAKMKHLNDLWTKYGEKTVKAGYILKHIGDLALPI
ncbi:uncharacterized protein LOC128549394 [Mercenaria mercenaria]|uniref:uncharacterized protein LOC128549394 n=1 Tax=Mercenaria mercenaria TaxID=6596 RepID=UPI00234E7416|nr:uncharacterized protein LOC128549394 [Mercenaria mercenaria]